MHAHSVLLNTLYVSRQMHMSKSAFDWMMTAEGPVISVR